MSRPQTPPSHEERRARGGHETISEVASSPWPRPLPDFIRSRGDEASYPRGFDGDLICTARRPLLVSLWAGFPGGRSWCRACSDSPPSKQLGRLKRGNCQAGSTTRVARWSPRHAGTGSSFGKLAAIASNRYDQVLLKIQQYAASSLVTSWKYLRKIQGVVTAIGAVVTALTGVKIF